MTTGEAAKAVLFVCGLVPGVEGIGPGDPIYIGANATMNLVAVENSITNGKCRELQWPALQLWEWPCRLCPPQFLRLWISWSRL
jgi:hypothetical protein